ncbi:MAG: NfeD family protein [Bacteroidales bacterium]
MRKNIFNKLILLLIIGVFFSCSDKQKSIFNTSKDTNDTNNKVYVIELKDDIGPHTNKKIKLGFDEAQKEKVALIVINLNTYGGIVIDADSIRTRILNSNIPVYAFIENNAISAGALIAIACDSIYMKSGSNIGAATVVNQTGEAMPDKYQSFMRSMMRSTAEANNRNPDIAQAMVDPDVEVPGISEKGKVLTLSTEEAIRYGFCEAKVKDLSEVISFSGIENPVIIKQKISGLDKLTMFLIKPLIRGIIIMMIVGGIYFEFQTPGIGFPLAIAILGLLLYFFPLYANGLVAYWEIIVFILGLILIILEIFVIPGFGIAGISGIALMIVGLAFATIPNEGFKVNMGSVEVLLESLLIILLASIVGLVLSIYFGGKLITNKRNLKIALYDVQSKEAGYEYADEKYKNAINKIGVAYTVLRPSGKIIVDDNIYDAISEGGWIDKDTQVKIIGYRNGQLIVENI